MLDEHTGEISSTQFEFTGEFCATGSIDKFWYLILVELVKSGISILVNVLKPCGVMKMKF